VKSAWAIVTIQGILDNDFYIGTLRQGKYTRAKINGKDVKKDELQHIVIEHHHQAIIDYRTFATVRALRDSRSTAHYRGVKKNDNVYSGFLECGDCGSPMFAMSRRDIKDAYRCGEYHRRGLKACTSHHIRVDKLDELLKIYVQKVKENSAAMLDRLNRDLEKESEDVRETEQSAANLEAVLADLQEELKATKRQRVRDIMKHPEREAILEETYDELESDLLRRMEGLQNQIQMTADKRNTIIQVNRAAKTAMDVFDDILNKPKLDRNDLELIIQKIKVYEDHLEIQLKADVDSILRCGSLEELEPSAAAVSLEGNVNFPEGTGNIEPVTIVQRSDKRPDKVFRANVISDGDPLEIFTDKDGGVIFKKYSLMGGLTEFAGQLCDTLNRTTGEVAVITDRDNCIAVAGSARRELQDKRISPELEQLMEGRQIYQHKNGSERIPLCEEDGVHFVRTAAPILSEGDVLGCVLFTGSDEAGGENEVDYKLVQSMAGFLGKHMES
jgi:stage V sporulation protein T